MTITLPYNFGDIVFLKTDPEQLERMICKVVIYQGSILYGLAMGSVLSEHYDFEMATQKDLMKELNISNSESV